MRGKSPSDKTLVHITVAVPQSLRDEANALNINLSEAARNGIRMAIYDTRMQQYTDALAENKEEEAKEEATECRVN